MPADGPDRTDCFAFRNAFSVHEPEEPHPVPDTIKLEVEIALSGRAGMGEMDCIGRRSMLTCPACNGVMWEIEDSGPQRYRCHLGHAYSAEGMGLGSDEELRRALGQRAAGPGRADRAAAQAAEPGIRTQEPDLRGGLEPEGCRIRTRSSGDPPVAPAHGSDCRSIQCLTRRQLPPGKADNIV
jgi:hypothetical protein